MDTIETLTVELIFGGIPFKFLTRQVFDIDPDLSDLGEYTSKLEPHVIVRGDGILLGPEEYESREIVAQNEGVIDEAKYPEDFAWEQEWLREHWLPDNDEPIFEWYGGADENWTVEARGYRILAQFNGSVYVDRHAHPYFRPPIENYMSKNSTEAEKQEAYKYCLQDWARAEAYERQEWWMTGVITDLFIHGQEIGGVALWGIESDGDYWKEVAQDQRRELLYKFAKEAAEHAQQAKERLAVVPRVIAYLE